MAETFEAFEYFIEGNAPDQFLVRQGVKCAVRAFVGCTSHCLDELVKKMKEELAKAYEETGDIRYHDLRQMIPDFEKSKSGLWAAFVREHLAEIKQAAKKKREDNRTLRELKKRKQEEEKGLEALSLRFNGVAVEAAEQSAQLEETSADGVAEDGDDTIDSFCGALVPPELSALSEEPPPLEGEGQAECGNDGSAVAPSSPTEPNRDQISTWVDNLYLPRTDYRSGEEEKYDTDGGSHSPAVLHLQHGCSA
ncbi:hypothetical protein AB1Y20_012325 [Prymnesium parvum]|uniref:Uncharacterized protein n=1 Tax=Prymnesium parvum TaxID=97485 RepID=A0AB34IR30_PRYPA